MLALNPVELFVVGTPRDVGAPYIGAPYIGAPYVGLLRITVEKNSAAPNIDQQPMMLGFLMAAYCLAVN